ncbi:MAG TPA: hypothetical protein VMQ60_03155 [Acidobacteriaceae bacterium]|jgi:hypothetical protein|nr:hypothetical protein [Acidobacteriaceae bacterium]
MSDEIKDSCTHGEESWYCVICRDDYVEGLQAQVAQLQTTVGQIRAIAIERPAVGYKDGKHYSALDEIAALATCPAPKEKK